MGDPFFKRNPLFVLVRVAVGALLITVLISTVGFGLAAVIGTFGLVVSLGILAYVKNRNKPDDI